MGMPNCVRLKVFTWDGIISPDYINLVNKLGGLILGFWELFFCRLHILETKNSKQTF